MSYLSRRPSESGRRNSTGTVDEFRGHDAEIVRQTTAGEHNGSVAIAALQRSIKELSSEGWTAEDDTAVGGGQQIGRRRLVAPRGAPREIDGRSDLGSGTSR